jgi:predicted phage terminase large subunit-like protein
VQIKRNFNYKDAPLSEDEIATRIAPYGRKFAWFTSTGNYVPHYYQILFHALSDEDQKLLRFRHLVAGRRGGKTLSAAWDALFYCMSPEDFHWDFYHKESDSPLYGWVLYKDNPTGLAAWTTFRDVIRDAGLVHGREYKEHKGNRWFEFSNGSFVHFRTAEDPESLRGAGLDFMWIDEAAIIPNERAWEVSYPALVDKPGVVWTSTTPKGKNWYWDEFWIKTKKDLDVGRVEYRTIDNPHISKDEWKRALLRYHPLQFKQEFLASFDAMSGVELSGDWLHYYTMGKEVTGDLIPIPRDPDTDKLALTLFMGVDPAISLSDRADRFAMALLGVSKDHMQVFLLDQYADRIPFPEQVDKINEWYIKYKPSLIGIESNAYQAALAQQVMRLPNLPPIVPMLSRGEKKEQRIMAMAPLFRVGKIRIRKDQRDFIDEWLNYDSTIKNPKDDCLDSVEIALRTAGALLPEMPQADIFNHHMPAASIEEWARRDQPGSFAYKNSNFDPDMGEDY